MGAEKIFAERKSFQRPLKIFLSADAEGIKNTLTQKIQQSKENFG
jgi:hypothetical protein